VNAPSYQVLFKCFSGAFWKEKVREPAANNIPNIGRANPEGQPKTYKKKGHQEGGFKRGFDNIEEPKKYEGGDRNCAKGEC